MSTADTALSISIKMAPGPDHRQEPVAPDRSNENLSDIVTTNETATAAAAVAAAANTAATTTAPSSTAVSANNNLASISSEIIVNATVANTDTGEFNANQSPIVVASGENKQEEPAKLATLNEGELRALLDEAITYKSPKDREGKSNLFKELLQEAEADETEEGRRIVASSRCIPGSNRRRHKRDSVSERLTHGGSLQNLAQPINSEFDSSFAYLTSGSSHTYGGGRRKGKKHTGPSVSARQREGGSLPSNVNASHSLASLANLDLVFDKKKGFSEERSVYDWTNKEKSKSLDKPSYGCGKKEDKDKDKKEVAKRDNVGGTSEVECESREKKGVKGKSATNEMLESDNPPPEYKPDYMVIDFDFEVDAISDRNAVPSTVGAQRPRSVDTEDDEGTEMKIIEPRRPVQVISRANFDAAQTPVDTAIEFPIREQTSKQTDKSKVSSVNGTETSGALSLQTYNSVKCVVSGTLNLTASTPQGKVISSSLYSVMPVSWPSPNIAMEAVSRLTAQHIPSAEKKSLDENGNAVQGHNGERKKVRRKHTQEPNVIVYKAENVEGHRNIEDIDTIVEFIENKESKGKKGKASNAVRVKAASGTKPRTREKDTKREQLPAKLQKSNSLEEISKTKLEDLTAEKSTCSSGASSISSQHGAINVALRRAKQRSTGDSTVDSRGDRRSWGTEEGQSIYCNDTGDDYSTRRNSTRKTNIEAETETEFLVVTKKKKSKKQRRSSSGGRAQNLASSGSYLQRSSGFANDYRTPLSPELRRKSTSSMPPSDKSDSSDLDSVHSLPVTSNSSKHNLTKNATSSGGTPQASYADIARTATINMSPSGVLSISTMVPNMLNTGSWPTVPTKSPSEPDKFPQDYYPSLDELQQSDRKLRQHPFAYSNHVHGLSLSFDKPPSPTQVKTKNVNESKKAEAREEAINKNIQVFKYVQDIEKMHQSLSHQELQKQQSPGSINSNPINASNNNQSSNDNGPPSNSSQAKSNSLPLTNNIAQDGESNNPHETTNITKESNVNTRANYNRSRRNYQQSAQATQHNQSQSTAQESTTQRDGRTTTGNPNVDEINKNTILLVNHNDEKDSKKSSNPRNSSSSSSQEELDNSKTKGTSNQKNVQQQQSPPTDSDNFSKSSTKTERLSRALKDQQQHHNVAKCESSKATNVQNAKGDRQDQSVEVKRSRQQNCGKNDKEQSQKLPDNQQQNANRRNFLTRPAVILMDENSSDPTRNSDSPSELTFGFEVNEQLLLSEDVENSQPDENPVFPAEPPHMFTKPPPNFGRPPPIFDKQQQQQQQQQHQQQHVRYDKFPPNFPMHPAHLQAHHHGIPHPQAMITSMPYLGYPPRFQPLAAYQPSQPPPSSIIEKYHQQPKEDFSARYVAPEESVNVHNYNHDKIVTFVGLAWDAVMREIPVTAATGRVQYYSGQ